jgi:hypothetical protein
MEKPQVDGRIVFYIDGSYGFFDRSRWLFGRRVAVEIAGSDERGGSFS